MTKIDNFKRLLDKVDGIEGHTVGGRLFKIAYDNGMLHTQIFQDGNVFEPNLRIVDVVHNNILSIINKVEKDFFTHSRPIVTERKNIHIDGTKDNSKFKVEVVIENTYANAKMDYLNHTVSMNMGSQIPNHIPINQRHNWLYLHFCKPESWGETLEYTFRSGWYKCCGNSIYGSHKYCHFCGKEQVVDGVVLDNIIGEELLTKLT